MRLNKNKHLFTIVTNEAGKILNISSYAASVLNGKLVGDDVFNLVDASELRKLSMYNSKAIITKSSLADYPNVIMRARLDGYVKTVELCFISKDISIDNVIEDAEQVLSLYSEKRNSVAKINPLEYIEDLISVLTKEKSSRGMKISISGEAREIEISPVSLELIIFTTISVLVDINFKGQITINLKNDMASFELSPCQIKSIENGETLREYPQITSRIYLLRSICEDEGIDMSIYTSSSSICIDYNLSRLARGVLPLKAIGTERASRILHFIDTLFA